MASEGGGEFVAVGDWQGLGSLIAELDGDRARLAELVQAAARSGRTFDHDRAMQHRIDLIRTFAGRSGGAIATRA